MKNNRKKWLCYIVMITMALSIGGCGKSNSTKDNGSNQNKQNVASTTATTEEATTQDEEEPIVITVLTDDANLTRTKYEEYKTTFEKDNENVIVELEYVMNYEDVIENKLKNGSAGDVVLIPNSMSNDLLTQYFEPLGTLEELSESYDEKYLHSRTIDHVVYGLPRYVTVHGVAYNEVVLAKAGVMSLPKTPGEFLAMLIKIEHTQPKVASYYTGYMNGDWLWNWQANAWGATSADPDYKYNRMVTEEEPFAEGTPNYVVHKLLYDIVKSSLCETYQEGKTNRVVFRDMNRGSIGCMMLSSSNLKALQSASVNPDDISFMPFPYQIEDKQYATVDIDYSYAINKNSANKEVAKKWIEYMIKKSGFAKSEGAISIKKNDGLPAVLSNFKDVELVVVNPPTASNADKYERLNTLSCIFLDQDVEKNRIIRSAIGESEESFEDIMEDWNLRWKAAIRGIAYATEKETPSQNQEDQQDDREPEWEITPEYQQYLEEMKKESTEVQQ